jgi:colicin import membrane protein
MTFRLRHVLAALILHALLFGLLIGGVQCSRKPERPPVIRAVLLDPSRQQVTQQKRREEQARQKAAEQERLRKQQEQQKRREAQERQEAERQRLAAEAERKQKEEQQRKQELEKQQAEELARKKKEQEAQREREEQARREVQERARMEEAMREEAMRRQIEQEDRARALSEREQQQALWSDAISRHVARNWTRPSSVSADFQCTVRVQQLPDGTVVQARIVKSCGTAQLDKSVEDAVFRSSPLPRPQDPSVFERELIIDFIPGPP